MLNLPVPLQKSLEQRTIASSCPPPHLQVQQDHQKHGDCSLEHGTPRCKPIQYISEIQTRKADQKLVADQGLHFGDQLTNSLVKGTVPLPHLTSLLTTEVATAESSLGEFAQDPRKQSNRVTREPNKWRGNDQQRNVLSFHLPRT